jgi:dolichyl-phosphate-mannose-protein mannosyltransferase
VLNATVDGYEQYDYEHKPIVYIEHGTRIKLRHVVTDKAMHSHEVRPPVSDVDFQNEVSAYGMAGFAGDINDDWIVEIEKGDRSDKESSKRLRTLRTHFKLRHLNTGCYLFSHKVKLPEWGFEQQEVTCNKNAVKDNSLWYVETAAKHPQRKFCASLSSMLSQSPFRSTGQCSEGQLQDPWFYFQVLGAAESHVDNECWID